MFCLGRRSGQNDPMNPVKSAQAQLRLTLLLALTIWGLTGCADVKPPIIEMKPPAAQVAVPQTNSVSAEPVPAPDLATNPPPVITALNSNLPSIFVAGDSTAARGRGAIQQGWGVPFADYFDPARVNVVNRGRGGRSSRTYVSEGLWDQLLASVKKGDIVLIQFGINDPGAVNDASRARGSLPGLGEETQEIDNQVTKQHEVVHTYGWYLRKMIADTKAKGATPIILTPTLRNIWRDGHIERGAGRYGEWAYQTARAARVLCIDVSDAMADKLESMGEESLKSIYQQDHTHFNANGADLHAATTVSLLKGLRPSPIEGWLSAKGKAVPTDPFSWLQLPHPANPTLPTLYLIGDSTVRNGRGDGPGGQWGWGDFLGKHFNLDKINICNQAVGGTTTRNYISLGHWARVIAMVKPGDFLMMQFGSNENGSPVTGKAAIKGIGDETITVSTNGTSEVVYTFGAYLRKFITETRARGATPIVCSVIPRKTCKDGKIVRSKDTLAGWAAQVAQAEDAPFVDLNELISARYDAMGPEKVDPMFADGHLHTTAAGAELNAQCVVDGLNLLGDKNPLAQYLLPATP